MRGFADQNDASHTLAESMFPDVRSTSSAGGDVGAGKRMLRWRRRDLTKRSPPTGGGGGKWPHTKVLLPTKKRIPPCVLLASCCCSVRPPPHHSHPPLPTRVTPAEDPTTIVWWGQSSSEHSTRHNGTFEEGNLAKTSISPGRENPGAPAGPRTNPPPPKKRTKKRFKQMRYGPSATVCITP